MIVGARANSFPKSVFDTAVTEQLLGSLFAEQSVFHLAVCVGFSRWTSFASSCSSTAVQRTLSL